MSEEPISPSQALAIAEIAEIRRTTPFASPGYTPAIHARRMALSEKAYPEPVPEPVKDYPEVLKPRREARQRDGLKRLGLDDGLSPEGKKELRRRFHAWAAGGEEHEGDAEPGEYRDRDYPEDWGTHQPTTRDIMQWDKAVEVAAKVGVSPE